MHNKPNQAGMTLIEVMVALMVVAISLVAASRAFSQWANGSQQLHERMLATICAQNTLTQWNVERTLPSLGQDAFTCEQDGITFQVRTDVSHTPNPKFRRAQVNVFGPSAQTSLASITTVVAKL